MFNNLIESTSHAKEFKRRGSFLLFTTATYLVLFVVTGVVSIYAYDAHLEAQTTELEFLTFVPPPDPAPADVISDPVRPASLSNRHPTQPTRTDMISSTSDPTRVPPTAGIKASDVPPWRPNAVISSTNYDPPAPPASVHGVRGGTGNTPVVNIPDDPPPAPDPTPVVPKILRVSSSVLQGKAVFLPKPNYPAMAKQIRLQGTVVVQVLIDEQGKVVSAKAVSGHPILVPGAQQAAMQSRFLPTKLGEQPVKVSGVITYNFVSQ